MCRAFFLTFGQPFCENLGSVDHCDRRHRGQLTPTASPTELSLTGSGACAWPLFPFPLLEGSYPMLLNLHRNLKELASLATNYEHARFGATSGVRLLDQDNGLYRAEATDGVVLAVVQGPTDPMACPFPDPLDGVRELVIDSKDWQKAFALDKNAQTIAVISNGATAVQLCSLSQTLRGQAVEGRFPDVNRVLPTQTPLFSVKITVRHFMRILKVCAAFCEEGAESVGLHYYGEKAGVIGFSCRNAEHGQTLDALLAPLIVNGK